MNLTITRRPGQRTLRSVTIATLLTGLLWFGAAPVCEAATDAAAAALLPAGIKQSGVLKVGMPLDFEPFNYLDQNGQKAGLEIDLLDAIADVLGVRPQIEHVGFDSLIPAVKGGRVDMGMSQIGVLPERLPTLSFVRYGLFDEGLIVARGNPSGITTAAACGHTVAVETGTRAALVWQGHSQSCVAAGKPPIKILNFEGEGPQVLSVSAGRADGADVGYATALLSSRQPGGKLQPAPGGPVPGSSIPCGMAIAKDNVALGHALEAALKVLVANGTYDRIYAKWGLSVERAAPAFVQQHSGA